MLNVGPQSEDRRRGVRVSPAGLLRVEMATRVQPGTQTLSVRDVSAFGFGLTAPQALPVTLGERVYVLIDWDGHPPIRGSLLRARIRRRRPDRDGWFVGVEIDDLRQTPWKQLAAWIEAEARKSASVALSL